MEVKSESTVTCSPVCVKKLLLSHSFSLSGLTVTVFPSGRVYSIGCCLLRISHARRMKGSASDGGRVSGKDRSKDSDTPQCSRFSGTPRSASDLKKDSIV